MIPRFTGLLLSLLLCTATVQAASFVVIADLNGRYGSTGYHPRVADAISEIIQRDPDFVIIAGDMIAAQRKPLLSDATLDDMWAAFETTIAGPLAEAGIPLVATAGNHDASVYAAFEGDRQAFARYWLGKPVPSYVLPDSNYPWHYAAGFEDTLVISLYGTAPGPLADEQQAFAQATLAKYGSDYDRVVVTTHLPIYPVANGREREVLSPDGFSGVARNKQVDWYVSGHHHAFYPGRVHGNLDGTIHLASPALGGNRRSWLGTDVKSPFGFVEVAQDNSVTLFSAPGFDRGIPRSLPMAIRQLRLAEDLIRGR
ncbi:MAG: metallophosphoesterase [Halieaceae bacterium]